MDIKKLHGEALQNANWEDAKAFCEAQEREMFETAKANGGYWLSSMGYIEKQNRHVESRLNEHDFSIARLRSTFITLWVSGLILQAALLLLAVKAFTGG